MQHPDPAFGVAGSEPPLSYPLADTAPGKAAPDLDIVADLLRLADELAKTWKDDAEEIVTMRKAAGMIHDLRAANARLADAANAETGRRLIEANALRAHNTRLSAELDAARGKEGR